MSLSSRRLLIALVALVCLHPGMALGADDDLQKGVALFQARQFQQAVPVLHRYAQAKNSPTATYYLALCYQNLRYEKEAIDLFERICSMWPASNEARMAEAYLKKVDEAKKAQSTATHNLKTNGSDDEFGDHLISKAEWAKLPAKTRIPFTYERGHMMVVAKVNGKHVKLAFDTGATKCSISRVDFPDVISAAEYNKGKTIAVARPHGQVQWKQCEAEFSVQDITRTVQVGVGYEPGVSLIGENFFKEYNYEIDNFYIRLTKLPYEDVVAAYEKQLALVRTAQSRTGLSTMLTSIEKENNRKRTRYNVPFVRVKNIMFVDIELNGTQTKAIFDTGCAADGIVIPPGAAEQFGQRRNSDGPYFERLTIGPVTRTFVKSYSASGLTSPLIGPKIFGDRPYVVDQKDECIKFQY